MFRVPPVIVSTLLSTLKQSNQGRVGLQATIMNLSPYSTCTSKDVREVQIPVPWGHISGKWWGPPDVQPVLCLHGWQDNAGTWDRLAPMLPSPVSLLAIDLPGHGLSSHFHPGRGYHFVEYVTCIRRIMRHYKWDDVSFLTHSLGSIVSFVFSAVYPNMVKNYVAIDAMKPITVRPSGAVRKGGQMMDRLLTTDEFNQCNTPSYTYKEASDRLVQGTKNSVTDDVSGYLLARGLSETSEGRFQYRRDARLKTQQLMILTQAAILEIASNVRCNVCHIVADPGLRYDTPELHDEVHNVVKKVAKSYEFHKLPGMHHIHLTEPEKVAPIVARFLQDNSKL